MGFDFVSANTRASPDSFWAKAVEEIRQTNIDKNRRLYFLKPFNAFMISNNVAINNFFHMAISLPDFKKLENTAFPG
ncbi:MAG: hypothetical protein KAU60_12715, partial [Desulfobacterales bacterium]|nr:hypothetical protein [Desulfobacterales bacterium]